MSVLATAPFHHSPGSCTRSESTAPNARGYSAKCARPTASSKKNMKSRHSHIASARAPIAPMHRGPQAHAIPIGDRRSTGPRAQRRAPHRLRQRHDGDPLRPPDGAAQPPLLRHHPGQGGRAARLRRLAPLSAVHRAALRVVDRPDLRAGLRLDQEERDRHPARDRRASSWSSRGRRSAPSSCSPATPTSRAWSSSSRSTASTSSASASASRRATCWSRTATSTTATTSSPAS